MPRVVRMRDGRVDIDDVGRAQRNSPAQPLASGGAPVDEPGQPIS
jgi:hypothetical protein